MSFSSFADDYSEALLLFQQAQDVLREASGGMPDPVKYANAIKQLEQAEGLAEKATAREPDKAERLLQDISGARFWAQKFATTQAASALRGEKITPPPSSPAKPATVADKGATPPPADAKPVAAAPTGDLAEQADQLMRDGKMKEASELWMKALEQLSKETTGAIKKAAVQSRLGNYFYSQGLYDQALKHYTDALATDEKRLGPVDAQLVPTLKSVGETLFNLGNYKKAEPHLLRAVKLSESFYGPDHLEPARVRTLLCMNFLAQKKDDQAKPLLAKIEAVRAKQLKPEDPEHAKTIYLQGWVMQNTGNQAEAKKFYLRCIEQIEKTRGHDHPSVCLYLGEVAYVELMSSRHDECVKLLRRKLEIQQKALSEGHPDICSTQQRVALEIIRENAGEAQQLLEKAQAGLSKIYGPESSQMASLYLNWGKFYSTQNKIAESEENYLKSQAIAMKLGESGWRLIAVIANDLGVLKSRERKFAEAEKFYKQGLQYAQYLGDEGMSLSTSYWNLAHIIATQGRFKDAYPSFQMAVDLADKAVGADAPRTRAIAKDYAAALRAGGRAKDGEALDLKYRTKELDK